VIAAFSAPGGPLELLEGALVRRIPQRLFRGHPKVSEPDEALVDDLVRTVRQRPVEMRDDVARNDEMELVE